MENRGKETVWNIYFQDIRPREQNTRDRNIFQPESFSIRGNFPNPFNLSTTIEYSIGEEGHASLVIYNSTGQKVRVLVSERIDPGVHHVVWDGTNDRGETVSTGMRLKNHLPTSDVPIETPKKVVCPFGVESCRQCKIALIVKGKIECSITVLALNTLKEGIEESNG